MCRYICCVKRSTDNKNISQEESTEEPRVKQRSAILTKNGETLTMASYVTNSFLMRAASQCFVPTVGGMGPPADHESSKCHKEVTCIIQGNEAPEKTAAMREL
ncbi:hypothetical protein XENORESO_015582 [Xenotaenia resolanae]|uniref:Uncharacterized protein n=1 Tax=Xenotaenia resolanae TaxID=208358 RepID=A0ABV0WKH7_9TELE